MTDRNWEAELAKIDKQLSSISDEQLVADQRNAAAAAAPRAGAKAPPPAAIAPARGPVGPSVPVTAKPPAGPWASWLKVSIAVAAAVGLMFWPWPARCGIPLIGFTAATGAVSLLGMWSAIGTWRHRLGLAHAASLLVVVWGLVLGAREALPRVGYAIPTLQRGAGWSCDGVQPLPERNGTPGGVPTGVPASTSPFGAPRG